MRKLFEKKLLQDLADIEKAEGPMWLNEADEQFETKKFISKKSFIDGYANGYVRAFYRGLYAGFVTISVTIAALLTILAILS
jgi:hypothetical protein